MSKRVFLPKHFSLSTLKEEPQHLAGYTGDGKVVLTSHGRGLVLCEEMDHEAAMVLARELLSASCDAKRAADRAAGLHEWAAMPIANGRFDVAYYGHAAVYRPIVNSVRRSRRYPASEQPPRGHRCSICRTEAPEGATMYVWESGETDLRGHRACQSCMRPDLKAAALGLSLLATQAGGGAR